jgi:hypothetical protein
MSKRRVPPPAVTSADVDLILGSEDTSLLDVVDNVLNKGVVLTGDITIGLAQVDLVYLRLSLLLCAADRVFPEESTDFMERHSARHSMRDRRARRAAESRAAAAAAPRRSRG